MLVNSLFLLAVILSVMCIASSSSTTVQAYTVKFNNGSILNLDPKYFAGSFPNIKQNGLAPNIYAWELSLLADSNFNGSCSNSYFAAMGASCDQTVFPDGPTSTEPNSDGSGVQIILQTNFQGNPWFAAFNVICDPTATTLKSPSNAYQASRPATIIEVAFTLTSAGACLSVNPPPPPAPPAPPSPTSSHSVHFNNGSILTLDPKYFSGSFPNIQQNGLAPNTYAWELSLLAASNFNGACNSSYFAAQGASCDQTVFPDGPTSTLPNSDGTGVQIVLQTNFMGNPWQATFNVICDPTATVLASPSNSYQCSRPATTIVVAFTMTSAGACLPPNPPPPPPTTTATTTTTIPPPSQVVFFPNGSSLIVDPKQFQGWLTLEQQQSSLSSSLPSHLWGFSLGQASNMMGYCPNETLYLAEGSQCSGLKFENQPSIMPNLNETGVLYNFFGRDSQQRIWNATINVECDETPLPPGLYSHTGSYSFRQLSSNEVNVFFKFYSRGACLPRTPTPSPPPPAPPAPPSGPTTVLFPNGSKLTLFPQFFTATVPHYQQQGGNNKNYSWYFSLVQKSNFNGSCNNAPGFLAEGQDCGNSVFSQPAESVSYYGTQGVVLVFVNYTRPQGYRQWVVRTYIACDPTAAVLTPVGPYTERLDSNDVIIIVMDFVSRGACLSVNEDGDLNDKNPPSLLHRRKHD